MRPTARGLTPPPNGTSALSVVGGDEEKAGGDVQEALDIHFDMRAKFSP